VTSDIHARFLAACNGNPDMAMKQLKSAVVCSSVLSFFFLVCVCSVCELWLLRLCPLLHLVSNVSVYLSWGFWRPGVGGGLT
jgi:hypothetical protein